MPVFDEPPQLVGPAQRLQDEAVSRHAGQHFVKAAVGFEQFDRRHPLIALCGDEFLLPAQAGERLGIDAEPLALQRSRLEQYPEQIIFLVRGIGVDHRLEHPAMPDGLLDPAFFLDACQHFAQCTAGNGIAAHQVDLADFVGQGTGQALLGDAQVERIVRLGGELVGKFAQIAGITAQEIATVQVVRDHPDRHQVTQRRIDRRARCANVAGQRALDEVIASLEIVASGQRHDVARHAALERGQHRLDRRKGSIRHPSIVPARALTPQHASAKHRLTLRLVVIECDASKQ